MLFDLAIVTPQGPVYQGRVHGIVLPGSEGQFGVLEGHERFLAPLAIGEAEIRTADGVEYAAVSGGFADVSETQVVVLAETCERASDIDTARAERARARAQQRLEQLRQERAAEHDFRVWEAALERAVVRLQAARRTR